MIEGQLRERENGRWDVVGTSERNLELVASNGDYRVLFSPGGHHPSGTGRPWNYHEAEYHVWRLTESEDAPEYSARLVVKYPARWRRPAFVSPRR